MSDSNDDVMVTRVVYHKAKAGREARFLQMMVEVAEAWKKQLPEIVVTRYRSATSERGVYVVLVKLRAINLHHFYDWTGAALEAGVGSGRDRKVFSPSITTVWRILARSRW